MNFDPTAYMKPGVPISPRTALSLWSSACAIRDRGEQDDTTIISGLPRAALPYAQHPSWRGRLLDSYAWVADRLAVGAFPLARCTGEELALHIVISHAAMADAAGVGPEPEEYGLQLIPGPEREDYAATHGLLFEDHDLLLLFDPVLDGIEDPESEVNQRLGIGPLLHPANWFEPFPGYADADPLQTVTPKLEDEDVLDAANDLAVRTGARSFSVRPTAGGWTAAAVYRQVTLTGFGEDAQSAATALVREIIEGGRCPSCVQIITIDPGSPVDQRCHWQRHGPRWTRGCEEQPPCPPPASS